MTEKKYNRFCRSNSFVKNIKVQEDKIYYKWSADSEFMLSSENHTPVVIIQLENIMSNLLEKSHEEFIGFRF